MDINIYDFLAFKPSSFSPTMTKVLCTCSCEKYVSRSTKQNHLKGRGTTALRATVLAETELLKMLAGQPQELQKNRGSNKRLSFNPDEGGSGKPFKTSHFDARPETDESSIFPMDELEASPMPEVPSAHTDPLPAAVIQSNRVVERTRHMMEQCWGARRNNMDDNDNGGEVEDNDDNEDGDNDDEDNDDEDNNDEDNDDGDNDDDSEDEDPDIEAENKILGLSTWDLLSEDFEREAAALGLSSKLLDHLPNY